MKCDLSSAEMKAMKIERDYRERERLAIMSPTGITPPWIIQWAKDEADAWLADAMGERQEVLAL